MDYTEDLKRIDVPALFIHGDDDQIVSLAASAEKAAKMAPKGRLSVWQGGQHGLAQIEPDRFINADCSPSFAAEVRWPGRFRLPGRTRCRTDRAGRVAPGGSCDAGGGVFLLGLVLACTASAETLGRETAGRGAEGRAGREDNGA